MFEEGIEKGEGDAQWLAPESLCFEMGYDVDKNGRFNEQLKKRQNTEDGDTTGY